MLGTRLFAHLVAPIAFAAATLGAAVAQDPTDLTLQLRFIFNAQFAGSYLAAENGHYAEQGLNVTIQPGGGGVAPDPVVAQGSADIGISTATSLANSVAQGAPLKAIAAAYQRSGSVIMSLPDNPIATAEDLRGKKLGAVSANLAPISAFLRANGLSESDVELVSIQGDAAPLLAGSVDAILTTISSQPTVLRAQGIEPVLLRMSENGFDELDMIYFVTESTLADPAKREAIVRFLRAERAGWSDVLANPVAGAEAAVNIYGKELDLKLDQQIAQVNAADELLKPAEDNVVGLLGLSEAGIAKTLATLAKRGVTADAALFDPSLIEEAAK